MSAGTLDLAILDRDALNANTMSLQALQCELFKLYFDQVPTYLDMMEAGLEAGRRPGPKCDWANGAHGLKGSALNLGLHQLADIATRAEKSPPTRAMFDQVRHAVSAARAAANSFMI